MLAAGYTFWRRRRESCRFSMNLHPVGGLPSNTAPTLPSSATRVKPLQGLRGIDADRHTGMYQGQTH